MKVHIRVLLAALALSVGTASSAYAEVMDKEPSLAQNWVVSAAGGLVAIVAWRWRWWAGLTITSLVLLRLLAVYLELRDPFVGPAIRLEAGEGYVTHFYSAVAVALVLNAVGAYFGFRRSRAA